MDANGHENTLKMDDDSSQEIDYQQSKADADECPKLHSDLTLQLADETKDSDDAATRDTLDDSLQ